ncbi:hypothetical protein FRC12_019829 [Ceratobasidium sp. 428]|nr:hypothetical protein FRC12_019829 [Ceratobasidium sp. 428]
MTGAIGSAFWELGFVEFKDLWVDLQDHRTALRTYIARLSPMSPLFPSRYYRAPDPSSLGFMLEYILPGTEPTAGARMAEGVKDLFVPLLQTTFKYFWSMAAGKTHHKNLSLEIEHITPIILASA